MSVIQLCPIAIRVPQLYLGGTTPPDPPASWGTPPPRPPLPLPPTPPQFGLAFRRAWEAYLAYNEAFADALAEEVLAEGARRAGEPTGGIRALVQDYHLSLTPRLLRERLGDSRADIGIAHFSHTP